MSKATVLAIALLACAISSKTAKDIYTLVSLVIKKNHRFKDAPDSLRDPVYVALGSSFSAGPTVGLPIKKSVGFAQGSESYPMQIAKKLGINKFVFASSSGALLSQLSSTQLRYLGPSTRLVTLTIGGNDVNYTRDSVLLYMKHKMGWVGKWIIDRLISIKQVEERDFDTLSLNFHKVFREIKHKSPNATIVVVLYLTVMPPNRLDPLTVSETALLRSVGEKLAEVTRKCAKEEGVLVLDTAKLSTEHHAASIDPWVVGYYGKGAIVHPNVRGHQECANQLLKIIETHNIRFQE